LYTTVPGIAMKCNIGLGLGLGLGFRLGLPY